MGNGLTVALLNGAAADADPGALRALAQVNYGHNTALQVRGVAAQGLGLHMARLRQGTAELFDAALDEAAVRGWMAQAARQAGGDCSMRVTVFARGFDHRRPLQELAVDVLVVAAAPQPPRTGALRVLARDFLRPVPHLKHVGTFPLFHHRRQAQQAGYDDALFVDGRGADARIAEGALWNIGFWDGQAVTWPQAPALRGTAERLLQAGLEAQDVAQDRRPVHMGELPAFRAAFACNANAVQPIIAIDAVEYAQAPDLMQLLADAGTHAPWEALD
ncbi:aminotransferase class IV [Pseudoxanthomonas koreensis]|uniref:aminotransferase class IV n=1 Tax=Pseudoxanthomonas koreensis TaxID=266061 RepID=UPI0035A5B447